MKKSHLLDEVFRPYEKKLQAQEEWRRRLGVREVDRPTYEKYITGPIQRFDRRRNAFMTILPDNPFGEDFRSRFLSRTGIQNMEEALLPLPYADLQEEDRIGQSLFQAVRRICAEYEPRSFPVAMGEGRVKGKNPPEMSRLIKKVALFLGAEIVRITRLDPRWVYQDIEIDHPFAIVIAVPHNRPMNQTAPSHFSGLAVAETYARLKVIATQLADFIRGLGYDAVYRETLGRRPEMIMVPLAIDAGIGEFARNGRVLSPEFGINMRLKAVTTDLPLEPDKPISFGTHEFFLACEQCARHCPASAIPLGPPTEKVADPLHNNPGFRKWYIHAERCLTFFAVNKRKWISCGGRCIAVCPWNKPFSSFHNLIRWIAIHSSRPVKKALIRADRLFYPPSRVNKSPSG